MLTFALLRLKPKCVQAFETKFPTLRSLLAALSVFQRDAFTDPVWPDFLREYKVAIAEIDKTWSKSEDGTHYVAICTYSIPRGYSLVQ